MHMTAEQLKPNFEPFGNIEEVTIIYDKATHLSKGTHTPSGPVHRPRPSRTLPRTRRVSGGRREYI